MELWQAIDHNLKLQGFADIWLERWQGKLGVLEHEVKDLELEIIMVLRLIHAEKNEELLEGHVRKFLILIHNVQPTREWQEDIQEELDELAKIAKELKSLEQRTRELKERARDVSIAKMEARRKSIAKPPTQIGSKSFAEYFMEWEGLAELQEALSIMTKTLRNINQLPQYFEDFFNKQAQKINFPPPYWWRRTISVRHYKK